MKEKLIKDAPKVCRKTKGITLIALVITVIVMLILAGVSVSALMGNEGLFAKTASAADAYKQASEKENDNIQDLLNELDTAIEELNNKKPDKKHEEVGKVGDFVNYSVEVDGVTYDKWRILYLNNNGHMEIVCYNGPDFSFGEDGDVEKSIMDVANGVKLLNDASIPYKNGTYGYSTRHLGTDPSNPSRNETIVTTGNSLLSKAYPFEEEEEDIFLVNYAQEDEAALELFNINKEIRTFLPPESDSSSRDVWLASRYEAGTLDNSWGYGMHYVNDYNEKSWSNSIVYNGEFFVYTEDYRL